MKEKFAFIGCVGLTLLLLFLLGNVSEPEFDLTALQPQQVHAQISQGNQIIYKDTLTQTTRYMAGSWQGMTYRYVGFKYGWNDTITHNVTTTLWLADPVGNRACTQTVATTLGNISNTWTIIPYTFTCGLYWADMGGKIQNVTGTITPSIEIVMHGQ